MKTIIKMLTMATVIVIMAIGSFSVAQVTGSEMVLQATFDPQDKLVTIQGDTLWKYSNNEYDRLIAMNQEYNLQKVVRGPGDVYVLLPVGIEMKGVKRVPASALMTSPTPTPTVSPSPTLDPGDKVVAPAIFGPIFGFLYGMLPPWWVWLIFAALAVIAYLIYLNWLKENRRGAATAGPKFVERGLNDRIAADEFRRQARARLGENVSGQNIRVENLQKRRATGTVEVGYRDGTTQTRYLDNEVVYVADLHYPDGHVDRGQLLLSACGNPIRYGNVSTYRPGANFRFTDERPFNVPEFTEQEAQAARQARENRDLPAAIIFEDGYAMVTTGSNDVEIVHTSDTKFSHVPSNGEVAERILVERDGIVLTVENGRVAFGNVPAKAEEPAQAEDTAATGENTPTVPDYTGSGH